MVDIHLQYLFSERQQQKVWKKIGKYLLMLKYVLHLYIPIYSYDVFVYG